MTIFLNFIYSLIKRTKDTAFYLFSIIATISVLTTVFSDKILLGFKDYNFGTMAYTGPWFLPITFIGVLPAAVYALYLIGKEGNIFNFYIYR